MPEPHKRWATLARAQACRQRCRHAGVLISMLAVVALPATALGDSPLGATEPPHAQPHPSAPNPLGGASTQALAEAAGHSSPQSIEQPLRYGDQLFSCPDPDVFQMPGQERWVAACTSDYGQMNPIYGQPGYAHSAAALPIYETTGKSFAHWQFKNFVFPPGRYPWAALPPQGNAPGGRYWAPEIHKIGKNWVAYFGAEINPQEFHKAFPGQQQGGDFGMFVAWTRDLFGGNWHSRLLHYRGQFNNVPGNDQEHGGGVFDPSVARNPQTGQLDIVWAKQASQIFEGQLTPNGLAMRTSVHLVMAADKPWMCHPDAARRHCVLEGPVLASDPAHPGVMDLFANADGTWDDTYKTAVAVSLDPLHMKWTMVPQPIDVGNTGYGLQGPGIGAQPFRSPDGSWLMAVHLMTRATHSSQDRYLGFVHVNYNFSFNPLTVPTSMAVDGRDMSQPRDALARQVPLPVPAINRAGKPVRVVSYIKSVQSPGVPR